MLAALFILEATALALPLFFFVVVSIGAANHSVTPADGLAISVTIFFILVETYRAIVLPRNEAKMVNGQAATDLQGGRRCIQRATLFHPKSTVRILHAIALPR